MSKQLKISIVWLTLLSYYFYISIPVFLYFYIFNNFFTRRVIKSNVKTIFNSWYQNHVVFKSDEQIGKVVKATFLPYFSNLELKQYLLIVENLYLPAPFLIICFGNNFCLREKCFFFFPWNLPQMVLILKYCTVIDNNLMCNI